MILARFWAGGFSVIATEQIMSKVENGAFFSSLGNLDGSANSLAAYTQIVRRLLLCPSF